MFKQGFKGWKQSRSLTTSKGLLNSGPENVGTGSFKPSDLVGHIPQNLMKTGKNAPLTAVSFGLDLAAYFTTVFNLNQGKMRLCPVTKTTTGSLGAKQALTMPSEPIHDAGKSMLIGVLCW